MILRKYLEDIQKYKCYAGALMDVMCRVTKLDRARNERILRADNQIGGNLEEGPAKEVEGEYGHVMRREEDYVGRRAVGIEVQGRRRRGKRCLDSARTVSGR